MTKLLLLPLLSISLFANAFNGEVEKQSLNISAIVMFVLFVGVFSVGINFWRLAFDSPLFFVAAHFICYGAGDSNSG